jgi:ABC-2 type transport system ATP-binding protein
VEEPVLSVVNVVKRFGRVTAVNRVSFDVRTGEIFCLVGPNGAGKTTTLRIIAGILEPDEGYVVFQGMRQPWNLEVRRLIAYLPEDAGVYRNLTGLEYIELIGGLYGVRDAVERASSISGLGERLRDRSGSYSKGMKRRLLLAGALIVNPRLLVLDEPTAGLDVVHATAMRKLIVGYVKGSRASAVISSHNMLEVSYMCDRVSLINRGVIVESGSPKELLERYKASNLEEVFLEVVGGGS